MSIAWNERVAVRTAGKDYRAMLMDEKGPVPADEIPGLWALWNEAVGAKAPGDAGWLAKVTKGSKSLEEFHWVQASRLGMALARMKGLPAWEAEAEERWQVLAMQRLKFRKCDCAIQLRNVLGCFQVHFSSQNHDMVALQVSSIGPLPPHDNSFETFLKGHFRATSLAGDLRCLLSSFPVRGLFPGHNLL